MTYQEFKNQVLNSAFDIDGFYGAQCWDGAMYYMQCLGYPTFNCPITGYVQDIWNLRNTSGILNYCDEVTQLQPGDIVIFQATGQTPYSHIAIFDSDAGGNYGNFLGQNQGAYAGAFNIVALDCSGTFPTALRPKCFANTEEKRAQTAPIGNGKVTQFDGNVDPVNRNGLNYVAHCEDYGWREPVRDGMIAGSTGEGKRLEAIKITPPEGLELEVKVHIQDIGWKTYQVKCGESDPVIGTEGESKRLEAIQINVEKNTTGKTLKYAAHFEDIGWLPDNFGSGVEKGFILGSTGQSKRMEAIRMWLE